MLDNLTIQRAIRLPEEHKVARGAQGRHLGNKCFTNVKALA